MNIGMPFYTKPMIIDGKSINVRLWDLARGESFQKIYKEYLKICHGVLLVFDLSSNISIIHIENLISLINNEMKKYKIPAALIGNKSDLIDERKILKEDAEMFALKFAMSYFETSVENKRDLNDAITYIATKAYHYSKKQKQQ